MSLRREGSSPSLSTMLDETLDKILNPPHDELHDNWCSWHDSMYTCNCGTGTMSARSSEEEQRLPKPKVAGSNPPARELVEHEIKLA